MILFLDFDGVLHPNAAYRTPHQGIVLQRDGHALFEGAELLVDALEDYPAVRIVLSTSWVWMMGMAQAKASLPPRLQARILGSTWHPSMNPMYWDSLTRYEQIKMYVNRHQVKHWLAIDDNDFRWPDVQRSHLIHTNEDGGFLYTGGAWDDLALKLIQQAAQ